MANRTLVIPGSSPPPRNDAGDGGPRPGDSRAAREAAETIDATAPISPANGSPPSADRLAQLAADLPRIARDTYEIGREVAKGGIGRVVRARDVRLDRPVALKELLVWSEGQEQRFIHEALLTAKLQHPAIVPIYEAGRWPDGEPFYAMKLVSGRSLADLIDAKPMLLDRLALLPHVLTVAQAVAYAHSQRILHRDLKPANVLVGEFGETVVIDWGLAKGLSGSQPEEHREGASTPPVPIEPGITPGAGLTIEGSVVGTPAYMPPEQARGQAVDEAADIYAIGAMLYHLIAAVPPYTDVPWERLLKTIVKDPPAPLESLVPAISDELLAIVNKAMARDPAKRYPSAKALAEDLERFQTGQIVAAHTYSTRHLLRRFWKRNRTTLSTAIAALVALSGVIAYAFVKTDSERRYAESKQREAEAAERRADEARTAAEHAGRQATSRADELTLLQAQRAVERDPNEAIAWLKTLSPEFSDAMELRRLASDAQARGISRAFRGHTAYVNWIEPFGDDRFATASDDKTARVWTIATGESVLLSGHTDEVWGVAFSPDGAQVATVSKDLTARLWSLPAGEEVARTKVPVLSVQLQIRKDGSVVGGPQFRHGAPWIWRPRDGAARPMAREPEQITLSALSADGESLLVERRDGTLLFGPVTDGTGDQLRPIGKVRPVDGDGMWQLSRDTGTAIRGRERPDGKYEYLVLRTDGTGKREIEVATGTGTPSLSEDGDTAIVLSGDQLFSFDVRAGKLVERFAGQIQRPVNAYLSASGRTAVTTGFDGVVHAWDLVTGEASSYAGLHGPASFAQVSRDGKRIIASSTTGDLRMFEPRRAGAVITDHEGPATGVAVSADGRVASCDEQGRLRITDLSGRAIAEHALGPTPRTLLSRSKDRQRFLVFSRVEWTKIEEWRTLPAAQRERERGTLVIGTFDDRKPEVVSLPAPVHLAVFAEDGRSVIASLLDGSVHRIDPGGEPREIHREGALTLRILVSPDGASLALGTMDGAVRLLDLESRKVRELGRHTDAVTAFDFDRTGAILVSGSIDHTIHVWNLRGEDHHSIEVAGTGVRQVGVSPDGRTVTVLNTGDAVVRRWSIDTREALPPLAGHSGAVIRFQYSQDGRRILTCSDDHTARLFDVESGKSRALTGHPKNLTGADFGPGDRVVVTLGREGTVRVWPDDLPETIPELRAWLASATPDQISERPASARTP